MKHTFCPNFLYIHTGELLYNMFQELLHTYTRHAKENKKTKSDKQLAALANSQQKQWWGDVKSDSDSLSDSDKENGAIVVQLKAELKNIQQCEARGKGKIKELKRVLSENQSTVRNMDDGTRGGAFTKNDVYQGCCICRGYREEKGGDFGIENKPGYESETKTCSCKMQSTIIGGPGESLQQDYHTEECHAAF
jgi:hypothetical protein